MAKEVEHCICIKINFKDFKNHFDITTVLINISVFIKTTVFVKDL